MKHGTAAAASAYLMCVFFSAYAASLYTNLALNPSDVHDSKWTTANGYPHATSNSEYPAPTSQPPNPEYYALNAIDGKTANAVEGRLWKACPSRQCRYLDTCGLDDDCPDSA